MAPTCPLAIALYLHLGTRCLTPTTTEPMGRLHMHGSQEVVKEDPQMEEADLLPLLLVSPLCLSNSSGGGQTSKTGEAEEVGETMGK